MNNYTMPVLLLSLGLLGCGPTMAQFSTLKGNVDQNSDSVRTLEGSTGPDPARISALEAELVEVKSMITGNAEFIIENRDSIGGVQDYIDMEILTKLKAIERHPSLLLRVKVKQVNTASTIDVFLNNLYESAAGSSVTIKKPEWGCTNTAPNAGLKKTASSFVTPGVKAQVVELYSVKNPQDNKSCSLVMPVFGKFKSNFNSNGGAVPNAFWVYSDNLSDI